MKARVIYSGWIQHVDYIVRKYNSKNICLTKLALNSLNGYMNRLSKCMTNGLRCLEMVGVRHNHLTFNQGKTFCFWLLTSKIKAKAKLIYFEWIYDQIKRHTTKHNPD